MPHHGRVTFNELNTWKPQAAMDYYRAVFGWEFEETQAAGTDQASPYYVAKKDGEMVAGIFALRSPDFDGMTDHWFTYLGVDDLDAAIEASNAAGGQVIRQPFDIPNFGRMAVVKGATGAAQAFFQPAAQDGAA
ncbi:MAG: VOC family protein [Pseudomonadota bacterium]